MCLKQCKLTKGNTSQRKKNECPTKDEQAKALSQIQVERIP